MNVPIVHRHEYKAFYSFNCGALEILEPRQTLTASPMHMHRALQLTYRLTTAQKQHLNQGFISSRISSLLQNEGPRSHSHHLRRGESPSSYALGMVSRLSGEIILVPNSL